MRIITFLMTFLRTLFTYLLGAIGVIILLSPVIILLLLPKQLRPYKIIFYLLYLFYKLCVYALLMPIEITGNPDLIKLPSIIVSNHQSSLDIAILGMLCKGKKHLWLVLERYKDKFILGFFIRKLFITVNQESEIQAARSLIKAIKTIINDPQYLIIFPEGGRFTDGKVHQFFEGFAIIAKKTGYPVIPIYMENNYRIYPPYTFLIYYNKIKVKIAEPIYMNPQETNDQFSKRIHNWFEKQTK